MSDSALKWARLPQVGQIRDFFRSDFSTFWLGEKVSDLSHSGQYDALRTQIRHPWISPLDLDTLDVIFIPIHGCQGGQTQTKFRQILYLFKVKSSVLLILSVVLFKDKLLSNFLLRNKKCPDDLY